MLGAMARWLLAELGRASLVRPPDIGADMTGLSGDAPQARRRLISWWAGAQESVEPPDQEQVIPARPWTLLNKFRHQAERISPRKAARENYLVGLLPRHLQYALIEKDGLPFAVRHHTAIALRALASKPPGPLVRGGFFASFGTR